MVKVKSTLRSRPVPPSLTAAGFIGQTANALSASSTPALTDVLALGNVSAEETPAQGEPYSSVTLLPPQGPRDL